MPAPRHIFRTYVRATPEQVWQAITDPDFTRRYFHRTAIESTFETGAPFCYRLLSGDDAIVGEIELVEPPHRLVMTWRALYDPAMADEPPGRVEWMIEPGEDGLTRVTTVHRDLGRSPRTSASVASGWPWILHSMKSLLETGSPLPDWTGEDPAGGDDVDGEDHRRAAVEANNSAWELLGRDDVTSLAPDEADDLLGRAYAASYHWRRAAGRGAEHGARASWLVSRVHATLGHGDLALHHADRCAATVTAAGLGDFDLAYAHEARARALACLGRLDEAADELAAAQGVAIADADDREIVEADLGAGPWYGLATR